MNKMGRGKRSVDIVSFERELMVWILSRSTRDCYPAGVGISLISAAIFFKEGLFRSRTRKNSHVHFFMKSKLEFCDFYLRFHKH